MIQSYITEDGKTLYRVRIFKRSKVNPLLRVTKQQGAVPTEPMAKKIEAQLLKDIERELHQLEARGVLFGELVEEWYEYELRIKVGTGQRSLQIHEDYASSLKLWFSDYFRKPALDLNPYVLISIFDGIKKKGRSYGHMKKLKHILKAVFDFGIQSGLLPNIRRSPTFEVVLRRDQEKKPEILSMVEIEALVSKAYEHKHPWRRAWSAALLTGLRSGELYALKWSDIDWESKTINVNKSFDARSHTIKSTKSGYWRVVPISTELEAVLREQQLLTATTEFVFERMWEWDKGMQAAVLRRFCFLIGIPSVKFHTLRACFATQMLQSGVEAAKVMKICGWRELKTMQHYVRLAGIEIQGVTEHLKIFSSSKREEQANRPAPLFVA